MSKIKTEYFPALLDKDISDNAFEYIKKNAIWHDGIYSSKTKKITRKALSVDLNSESDVETFIISLVSTVLAKLKREYDIYGIYTNYYRDGKDYTPSHRHPDTIQLVISLGETRTLTVGTKEYKMNNGDVIVFGTSTHGIPQENNKKERISIATFMKKI